MRLALVILMLSTSLAYGQVDSTMPDEGPLSLAAVPAKIERAALTRCAEFELTSAEFQWLSDDGMYLLRGRCGRRPAEVWVTGNGRVAHFGYRESD